MCSDLYRGWAPTCRQRLSACILVSSPAIERNVTDKIILVSMQAKPLATLNKTLFRLNVPIIKSTWFLCLEIFLTNATVSD